MKQYFYLIFSSVLFLCYQNLFGGRHTFNTLGCFCIGLFLAIQFFLLSNFYWRLFEDFRKAVWYSFHMVLFLYLTFGVYYGRRKIKLAIVHIQISYLRKKNFFFNRRIEKTMPRINIYSHGSGNDYSSTSGKMTNSIYRGVNYCHITSYKVTKKALQEKSFP